MTDYLHPQMNNELREIPAHALASIGDAVFSLMVRTYLVSSGISNSDRLHSRTVSYVSAKAQAEVSEQLLPVLSGSELEIYKRGRNAHTRPAPKNTGRGEYHAATGVETLFGYLYLSGNTGRLNELFKIVTDSKNPANNPER